MAKGALNPRQKVANSPQIGRYCRVAFRKIPKSCDILNPGTSYSQAERVFADSRIIFNGIAYCSLSEAALGNLLEVYVPGFKIVDGETFQIPIGEGRSVDYRVNGVLVEYHQPRIQPPKGKSGDFNSREEYALFARELRRIGNNSWRRQRFIDDARRMLGDNYFARRRAALNKNPDFLESELIVAISREDFYNKVILRFAADNPPPLGEFIARFWWWVNIIAKQNGLPSSSREL